MNGRAVAGKTPAKSYLHLVAMIKEFMKRLLRQTGILKRFLFVRRQAWELAI